MDERPRFNAVTVALLVGVVALLAAIAMGIKGFVELLVAGLVAVQS